MIDGSFVSELTENLASPTTVTVAGREHVYLPANWTASIVPTPTIAPPVLHVSTLTGLVDYCQANRDGLTLEDYVVHVVSPETVHLLSNLTSDDFPRRSTLVQAQVPGLVTTGFQFDHFCDAEAFNVALQTRFVQSVERDQIVAFVAGIRENTVRETVDDGVAQVVTSRAGVALVSEARVPNPVKLAPYRTFREIEQPPSLFVLRLRQAREGDRPACALFEADGGMWKLEAMQAIAAHLRGSLPNALVVLA